MCDQCCHDPSINQSHCQLNSDLHKISHCRIQSRKKFIHSPKHCAAHSCGLQVQVQLAIIHNSGCNCSKKMRQLFMNVAASWISEDIENTWKIHGVQAAAGFETSTRTWAWNVVEEKDVRFIWCTWIERSAALPLNRTGIAAACSSSSFGFSIAEKKKTVDLQARPNPKAPSCNWVSLNYFLESKARSTASCSRSTCSSAWSHHEFSRAALQQTKGFLCLVSGAKKRTSLENRIYVLHIVCTRNVSWWVAAKSHNGFCLPGQTMNRNYRETSQLQL